MRDRAGAVSRARGSIEIACPPFDRSDWAWEYLRRNRDYQADWREAIPRDLPCVLLRDGTSLVRLTRRYLRAEQWGLMAFANPLRSAPHTTVFWLPSRWRSTIKAQCEMTCAVAAPNMFTLDAFHAKRTAAVGVDGIPVVWMKGEGFTLALIASGWDVLTRPAAVTFELAGFDELQTKIHCLELMQRLTQAAAPPSTSMPQQMAQRLNQTLQALDGSLAGLTYRQIAVGIFGAARVAIDWHSSSRSLKDRTRRLVAKGHQLMNGGYLDLLH
jgi:hypothetical protein